MYDACYCRDAQPDSVNQTSCLVRKKVFVYFLANHHSDDIVGRSLCGPRGWAGFRLEDGSTETRAELVAGI